MADSAAARAAQRPSPGMVLDKDSRTYRSASAGNTRDVYEAREAQRRARRTVTPTAPVASAPSQSAPSLSPLRPVTTMRKVADTLRGITGRRR